jgi:hypothetical protein
MEHEQEGKHPTQESAAAGVCSASNGLRMLTLPHDVKGRSPDGFLTTYHGVAADASRRREGKGVEEGRGGEC